MSFRTALAAVTAAVLLAPTTGCDGLPGMRIGRSTGALSVTVTDRSATFTRASTSRPA
jgi:hypothetical protein